MLRQGRLLYSLFAVLIASAPCSVSAEPPAGDNDGSQQPYFDRLMGLGFFQPRVDVVLAKIVGPLKQWPPGFDAGYALEILGDYRANLKEHQQVKMFGERAQQGSNIAPLEELVTNDIMLLAIAPLERAGEFRYRQLTTPVGLNSPQTVKAESVAGVKEALAELRRQVPLNGEGEVSLTEASRLLKSKNPLVWALGASLMAYDPKPADVESLKRMLNTQEGLTLPQAIWIHYLLTQVVPEGVRPSKADSDDLLVGYAQRYAKPLEPG
jgi:hypothetical protein